MKGVVLAPHRFFVAGATTTTWELKAIRISCAGA